MHQVVPQASAVVPGAADAETIAINADHINMVKFASKENNGYKPCQVIYKSWFKVQGML